MTARFTPDHVGVGEMLRSDFMQRMVRYKAEAIKARAEALAPVGDSTDPHRGRYRDSFHIRVSARGGATKDRAEAVVYNDSPEALYVEYAHYGSEPYRTLARAAFQRIP